MEIIVKSTFKKDTKNFNVYTFKNDINGVNGTIYIPKSLNDVINDIDKTNTIKITAEK